MIDNYNEDQCAECGEVISEIPFDEHWCNLSKAEKRMRIKELRYDYLADNYIDK